MHQLSLHVRILSSMELFIVGSAIWFECTLWIRESSIIFIFILPALFFFVIYINIECVQRFTILTEYIMHKYMYSIMVYVVMCSEHLQIKHNCYSIMFLKTWHFSHELRLCFEAGFTIGSFVCSFETMTNIDNLETISNC